MTLHERYDKILEGMLDAVRERYGERLAACAVYGSVGRDTMRGDSDIPTEEYTEAHGTVAYEGAAFVVALAKAVMSQFPDPRR